MDLKLSIAAFKRYELGRKMDWSHTRYGRDGLLWMNKQNKLYNGITFAKE